MPKLFMKNLNSIKAEKKQEAFLKAFKQDKYEFFAFTETSLNQNIPNSNIIPPTYVGIRRDRNKKMAQGKTKLGGSMIVYKESRIVEKIHVDKSIEAVASKIQLDDGKSLFLASSYLPRTKVTAKEDQDLQSKHLELYAKMKNMAKPNDLIIIAGDFNMPKIDWIRKGDHMLPENINKAKPRFREFIREVNKLKLKQINSIPNKNGRFLDLVFTNMSEICSVSLPTEEFTPDTERHHRGTVVEFNIPKYS